MSLRMPVLLALLIVLTAVPARAARDPDYDAALEAYTAKRWADFDILAPCFLEEKPDYVHAHAVRYMIAESMRLRKRYDDGIREYRSYLRHHPKGKYVDRCRTAVVTCMNAEVRHAQALEEADRLLEKFPGTTTISTLRYERAYALEGLRRFEEAAGAYRAIEGRREELARLRVGVALFRGRDYEGAREALRSFLDAYPKSKLRASAKDYLFRTDTGFRDVRDGIVRDYRGKYETDERLAAIRATVSKRREAALAEIAAFVGVTVPRTFLIRFEDAEADRSGLFARTRIEVIGGKPRHVVVLTTEYLVMGAFDLDRTLVHELYHALQRESLGDRHFDVPKWAREGAALYVARQGPARTRILAAEVGRRAGVADPMGFLVNGLGGRHTLDDYAEDVAAFEAAEERHGREKVVRLLRELLRTSDVAAAVRETLGEDLATFERHATERARKVLTPLVEEGRGDLLTAMALMRSKPGEALERLPAKPGAYGPVVAYYRARALHGAGRQEEALRVVREEFLAKHRLFASLLDNAIFLELKILRALGDETLEAAVERARKDLQPTGAYTAFRKAFPNN